MGKPSFRKQLDYLGDEIETDPLEPSTGWLPLTADEGLVFCLRITPESSDALIGALQEFISRARAPNDEV